MAPIKSISNGEKLRHEPKPLITEISEKFKDRLNCKVLHGQKQTVGHDLFFGIGKQIDSGTHGDRCCC